MFDNEVHNIASILKNFLGDPKDEYSYDSWSHWNCPCCATQKGVECDMKFNLEINIRENRYHCWVCGDTCGTKGKLSSLIKKYGGNSNYSEYKKEIESIRESRLFQFYNDDFIIDDIELDNTIFLPDNYHKIDSKNSDSIDACNYLEKRGITKSIIDRFNIGYVNGRFNTDISMKRRIVIPSYDAYNELNYWVARDYTNKSKFRYKNPRLEKTKFIFNEHLVNWYEDITLVEGVFDHIVVPNSIPLLGKTLGTDYYLYKQLIKKSKANINIFLDHDAIDNAIKIYRMLYSTNIKDKIRIITPQNDLDASDIYKFYGEKGIISILNTAHKISEYDLI